MSLVSSLAALSRIASTVLSSTRRCTYQLPPGVFGRCIFAALTLSAFAGPIEPDDLFSNSRPSGAMNSQVHKNLVIPPGRTATILSPVAGTGYISELFAATNQYATPIVITVDGESVFLD